MDLDAVRTFIAVVDAGRFQEAAADLAITQQAVSKRVAALEKSLGVALFTRTARGARLTVDGQAFLPHARELLQAADRAVTSVRPRRPLRVDVLGRRLGPAALLREFHQAHPTAELEVVTHFDASTALSALGSGTIDASFRAVAGVPSGVASARVLDEPVQLLTGPTHPLASASSVRPADLAATRIWMPGVVPGTEWASYYAALAATFGLVIDVVGPNFGTDPLLDTLAHSPDLATFVGEQTHLLWPAEYDLRRISLHDPTPVYPHSLIWRRDNPHHSLRLLRDYLGTRSPVANHWTPKWTQGSGWVSR